MIVLAYDHRGYKLMQEVKGYLEEIGREYVEFANKEYDPVDSYSLFAKAANEYILKNKGSLGIYSCGSGIGINIAANRTKGLRAGVCDREELAFLGRKDDDLNILVLPGNFLSIEDAKKVINKFLETPFEGGRHIPRIKMLDE